MHAKLPILRDRLNPELVTSPPRNKYRIFFRSQVVELEDDEEQTCSNEIGGGGQKEFYVIATQGNIEEEPEPNLDQAIDNIQGELIESIEHVAPIVEPTQPVIVATYSSQHVQHIVELIQIENPQFLKFQHVLVFGHST